MAGPKDLKVLEVQFTVLGWRAVLGWALLCLWARVLYAWACIAWGLRGPNYARLYLSGADRASVQIVRKRWMDSYPRREDYTQRRVPE